MILIQQKSSRVEFLHNRADCNAAKGTAWIFSRKLSGFAKAGTEYFMLSSNYEMTWLLVCQQYCVVLDLRSTYLRFSEYNSKSNLSFASTFYVIACYKYVGFGNFILVMLIIEY